MSNPKDAGWTVSEVLIATSVGFMVLAGAVVLTQTAFQSNDTVSKVAQGNRASAVVYDTLKNAASSASADTVVIGTNGGFSTLSFKAVLGTSDGEPVHGVAFAPTGDPVAVDELVARVDAGLGLVAVGVATPWTVGDLIPDASVRFVAADNGKGGNDLYRVWLTSANECQYVERIAQDVVQFDVRRTGDILELLVQFRVADDDDDDDELRTRSISIVLRS